MKSRDNFSYNRIMKVPGFIKGLLRRVPVHPSSTALGTVLFLLLTLPVVQSAYAEVEVTASLNVSSFPLDRAAALTISVTGARSSEPQMPEVEGLRFYQRGQSTQMNLINGAYSASVSTLFHVEAFREGDFTIPAIKVVTGEGTVMTRPITFTVTAPQAATVQPQTSGGSSSARLRSGESDKVAFLRVLPVKEKSYNGEIVPVQIKVYFRDTIKANLNSLPQLQGDGFVLQQLEREPEQTRELVNDSRYNVLSWQSALSGIKEGVHQLSVDIAATLLLPEQRTSPFGGHDPFFNNFFSSYSEKEVTIASPPLSLTVLPLPLDGRPEGFSGAIGDFNLDVTASPLTVSPGDPITLTMTLSGQGNFDRVQVPKLATEEGWKTYTPSSEFLKDGGPGHGKKIFEQALVAKDQNLRQIPAIRFSYFDPLSTTYKTLIADPVPLNIQERETEEAPSVAAKVDKDQGKEEMKPAEAELEVVPPLNGLAPLQLTPGELNQELTPLFVRKWFQVLAGLLLLLLLVVLVLKLRAARYAGNARLQREQAMKHLLLLRVQEIEQALAVNDSRGFLAACRRAIQEQLGLVWEMEAGAITYADLEKRLSTDSPLLPIFRAADESAYGGQELNPQEMQGIVSELKKELEGLR